MFVVMVVFMCSCAYVHERACRVCHRLASGVQVGGAKRGSGVWWSTAHLKNSCRREDVVDAACRGDDDDWVVGEVHEIFGEQL